MHRFVFLLCKQGRHHVCPASAAKFFRARSPLSSAAFVASSPLFAATAGGLEAVHIEGEYANFSSVKEVSHRMTIAAVSIFYNQVSEAEGGRRHH